MKKVLIVEDEPDISMVLRAYLLQAGYVVKQAFNGEEALDVFAQWKPALVMLDVLLPDTDGWAVLAHIRQVSSCPVIMLTALSDLDHKLQGLRGGADDYICKPFSLEEVVARVETVLRRQSQLETGSTVTFGSLKVDFTAREVWLHGQEVRLTPRDLDLLLFLAKHPNQSFEREQLIQSVWGSDFTGSDRAVDIAVTRIRQALAAWPAHEGEIVTLRRLGYKLYVRT